MKVPQSLRTLFDAQLEQNRALKARVDGRFDTLKDAHWHYESRLKTEEGFALKLESGRFNDPTHLEDFFACMLVVRDKKEMRRAEALIIDNFIKKERRPSSDSSTHKFPESFPFDDLRLYVEWWDDPATPPSGVIGIRFEVQIKTYLQHAWTIATHDLIYKSDSMSWPKERIAYQVKAMLEHAEIAIDDAEDLAQRADIPKDSPYTLDIAAIIVVLREFWSADDLPRDLLRLGKNVYMLLKLSEIPVSDLRTMLRRETDAGRGSSTRNLSPYSIVVQTLINLVPAKIAAIGHASSSKFRLLIPTEVDVPERDNILGQRNIIRC